MTLEQLIRMRTDAVLNLRGETLRELARTPEHLYPLLYAALRRRLGILNGELSFRAADGDQVVELADVYDPDAPLERALRPKQRRHRG